MSIEQFFHANNFQKHIDAIQDEHKRVLDANSALRQRIDEWSKDEEIQKLNKQVDELRRYSLHMMSENEHTENAVFQAEHYMKCKNGNRFQYELIGTGIGTVLYVRCPICGEQKNITDLNSW